MINITIASCYVGTKRESTKCIRKLVVYRGKSITALCIESLHENSIGRDICGIMWKKTITNANTSVLKYKILMFVCFHECNSFFWLQVTTVYRFIELHRIARGSHNRLYDIKLVLQTKTIHGTVIL